jgi:hypothetical protein
MKRKSKGKDKIEIAGGESSGDEDSDPNIDSISVIEKRKSFSMARINSQLLQKR